MITEKVNKYFTLDDFSKYSLEESLENVIKMLQEQLEKAKKQYPDCEYSLEFYSEYDDDRVSVKAARLETDEEFNKRVEKEKAHVLKQKEFWDNKAKEFLTS